MKKSKLENKYINEYNTYSANNDLTSDIKRSIFPLINDEIYFLNELAGNILTYSAYDSLPYKYDIKYIKFDPENISIFRLIEFNNGGFVRDGSDIAFNSWIINLISLYKADDDYFELKFQFKDSDAVYVAIIETSNYFRVTNLIKW